MGNKQDPVLGMLSIATKAGKIKSGEFSVEKSIKEESACLIIMARDSSDNSKKHFMDMCRYRDIPYEIYASSQELGRAIGKPFRMSVAVCDKGLAGCIQDKILMEDNVWQS